MIPILCLSASSSTFQDTSDENRRDEGDDKDKDEQPPLANNIDGAVASDRRRRTIILRGEDVVGFAGRKREYRDLRLCVQLFMVSIS
mmetsp:Transcript_5017/g.11164  ORF Transcript_5017/g.11164 Transcript_5017/m.11164 type:complete len:87 (-) Transcript_5017:141-401(-)